MPADKARLRLAVELVAGIRAAFPAWKLEDADVPVWATIIADEGGDFTSEEAARALRSLALREYPPRSPGRVVLSVREERRERPQLDVGEGDPTGGISLTEYLREHATEEERETARRIGLARLIEEG